jgi:ribosomal protein S18 acetylase RimI-like enzyme
MSATFLLEPLWKIPVPRILTLVNDAFSDYNVPIHFDETSFSSFLVSAGVSWHWSRLLTLDGDPIGFTFIGRRGWNSRLVAMGILANHRNCGYGSQALEQIIHETRARGDHHLELEVITSNAPAVHLYQKFGFRILQDLYGFQRPAGKAGAVGPLEEVDIRSIAHLIAAYGAPDLPWQLSAETIACYGPPMKAFHLEGAYAVISDPSRTVIALMSLIVEPEQRGTGRARALLRSLFSRYSKNEFIIHALCPAMFEQLLTSVGFERTELNQHHMRLEL